MKNKIKKGLLIQCLIFILALALFFGCSPMKSKHGMGKRDIFYKGEDVILKEGKKAVDFDELLRGLETSRVVYVGEQHTNTGHHKVQLKVLKALWQKDPSLVVGMEMFDHSYQPILGQWSRGELTKDEFIKKVHWRANWKYPYPLYEDILRFIRENRIRLVGLNIPFHIPAKISIGGVESLLQDDRKHLPEKIDTFGPAHRAYVEEVYSRHAMIWKRGTFDTFYQAQCAWETAMGQKVAENLKENKMVVLVGNGHIYKKFGLPHSAFTRTKAPFCTIYTSSEKEAEEEAGDYIWMTPPGKK